MLLTGRVIKTIVFSLFFCNAALISAQASQLLDADTQPKKAMLCIGDKDPALMAYALTVLDLDRQLTERRDVRDAFDQVVGIGTGALLGTYMMMPGLNGQKYRYSMREILNLFTYHFDSQADSKDTKMPEALARLSGTARENTVFLLVQDKGSKDYRLVDAKKHYYTGQNEQQYCMGAPLHLPWTIMECLKTQFKADGKGMSFRLLSIGLAISSEDLALQIKDNTSLKTVLSYAKGLVPGPVSWTWQIISTAKEYEANTHADILRRLQESYDQDEKSLKTQAGLAIAHPTSKASLCLTEYQSLGITPDLSTTPTDHVLTSIGKMKEKRGWPTSIPKWFSNQPTPDDAHWHNRALAVYDQITSLDFVSSECDIAKLMKLFSIAPKPNEFGRTLMEWAKDKDQLQVLQWVGNTIYVLDDLLISRSVAQKVTNYATSYFATDDIYAVSQHLQFAQRQLQDAFKPVKNTWTLLIIEKYSCIPLADACFERLFYRFTSLRDEGDTKAGFLARQLLPNAKNTTISPEYLDSLEQWIVRMTEETLKHNQSKALYSRVKETSKRAILTISGSHETKSGNHEHFIAVLEGLKKGIDLLKGKALENLESSQVGGTSKVDGFDDLLK